MSAYKKKYTEDEDYVIEEEETIAIEGHNCILLWETWQWRIWLQGRGDIGWGYNREDAIASAKEILQEEK